MINDLYDDVYANSKLDDNQKYAVIRRCIIHVFGKHSDELDQWDLNVQEFEPIMKFMSYCYKFYMEKKVESQKL